ncbi:MAG: HEAT repeat domain-containing protein [Planctomycetes bacterium]|nr:HEAT repeat domain-containing protein [Planctomycetota bacterium]
MFVPGVIISATLLCFAQDDASKPATIHFEPSLEAAFARAKKEKIPVLVCVVVDKEAASDTVTLTHYRDAELGELSKHAACVIANAATHAAVEVPDGESTRQVCGRFGSVTCAEHQAVDAQVRKRWFSGDGAATPQHLFVDPSGFVLARQAYLLDLAKLKKMLELARVAVDPASVDASPIERELQEARIVSKSASSKNQDKRAPALAALAAFEDPRAFQLLVDIAEAKSDDAIRAEAIRAMSQRGSYRALPVLIGILRESKLLVRNNAVVGLELLRLPEAIPPLLNLYKSETAERVRANALRALARCAPKQPDVVALVVKESASQSSLIRINDAIALGYVEDSPKILDILRKIADSNDEANLRGVAVWALGMHRDKGAVSLLERIAKSDKFFAVKRVAGYALTAIEEGPTSQYEGAFITFVEDEIERK